jgi:hypothetical protein
MRSLDVASTFIIYKALSFSDSAAFAPLVQMHQPCRKLTKRCLGNDNARGQSYVRSGMTPGEYARIKEKEKEKLSKMNFGALVRNSTMVVVDESNRRNIHSERLD